MALPSLLRPRQRLRILLALIAYALVYPGAASAAEDRAPFAAPEASASETADDRSNPGPFGAPLALGTYTLGSVGAYEGAGAGGRARWEFWQRRLGVETFAEVLLFDWPGGGSRHDVPIGFNLYAPLALGSRVRARAMAGFCAVFSFIEPAEQGAPPSNDVLFGAHAGLGLEVALAGPFVWFLDAQAVWYVGHDRTSEDWSGAVSGSLSQAVVFQPQSGLMVAFGR
jgi:hypothetical protein